VGTWQGQPSWHTAPSKAHQDALFCLTAAVLTRHPGCFWPPMPLPPQRLCNRRREPMKNLWARGKDNQVWHTAPRKKTKHFICLRAAMLTRHPGCFWPPMPLRPQRLCNRRREPMKDSWARGKDNQVWHTALSKAHPEALFCLRAAVLTRHPGCFWTLMPLRPQRLCNCRREPMKHSWARGKDNQVGIQHQAKHTKTHYFA
jgi:hypothetical protein